MNYKEEWDNITKNYCDYSQKHYGWNGVCTENTNIHEINRRNLDAINMNFNYRSENPHLPKFKFLQNFHPLHQQTAAKPINYELSTFQPYSQTQSQTQTSYIDDYSMSPTQNETLTQTQTQTPTKSQPHPVAILSETHSDGPPPPDSLVTGTAFGKKMRVRRCKKRKQPLLIKTQSTVFYKGRERIAYVYI